MVPCPVCEVPIGPDSEHLPECPEEDFAPGQMVADVVAMARELVAKVADLRAARPKGRA